MRSLFLLLFIFTLSCSGELKREAQPTSQIEEKEINKQFVDLDGKGVDFSDFKGKRLVVNYWATWCLPCLKEFPSFVEVQNSLKGEEIVFLFASPDKLEKIKEFKEAEGYDLNFLHLNPSLDKLDIYALPATFLYSSKGEIYKRVDGAMDWNSSEAIEMLKQIP